MLMAEQSEVEGALRQRNVGNALMPPESEQEPRQLMDIEQQADEANDADEDSLILASREDPRRGYSPFCAYRLYLIRRDTALGEHFNPCSKMYWATCREEWSRIAADDPLRRLCEEEPADSKRRRSLFARGRSRRRVKIGSSSSSKQQQLHHHQQHNQQLVQMPQSKPDTLVPISAASLVCMDNMVLRNLQSVASAMSEAEAPLAVGHLSRANLVDDSVKKTTKAFSNLTKAVAKDKVEDETRVEYKEPCGALCRNGAPQVVCNMQGMFVAHLEKLAKHMKSKGRRVLIRAAASAGGHVACVRYGFVATTAPQAGVFRFRMSSIECEFVDLDEAANTLNNNASSPQKGSRNCHAFNSDL